MQCNAGCALLGGVPPCPWAARMFQFCVLKSQAWMGLKSGLMFSFLMEGSAHSLSWAVASQMPHSHFVFWLDTVMILSCLCLTTNIHLLWLLRAWCHFIHCGSVPRASVMKNLKKMCGRLLKICVIGKNIIPSRQFILKSVMLGHSLHELFPHRMGICYLNTQPGLGKSGNEVRLFKIACCLLFTQFLWPTVWLFVSWDYTFFLF